METGMILGRDGEVARGNDVVLSVERRVGSKGENGLDFSEVFVANDFNDFADIVEDVVVMANETTDVLGTEEVVESGVSGPTGEDGFETNGFDGVEERRKGEGG